MPELLVDGEVFSGWKKITVTRSIEQPSGGFSFEVSDRESWSIKEGAPVSIKLDGSLVLTGWVDKVDESAGKSSHTLSVSGRDLAGDLVDCSAMNSPGEWRGLGLHELATLIAEPFGISVRSFGNLGDPFDVFKIQPGEAAWAAIERACRLRGFLAFSDEFGGLRISRAGGRESQVELTYGKQILSYARSRSMNGRFSEYTVLGQSAGSDDWSGESAAGVKGTATDPAVKRYRPLLVLAEASTYPKTAEERAQWEAAVRSARSETLEVSVTGWRQSPGGDLWKINAQVPVYIQPLNIRGFRLITGTTFEKGGQGTITKLALRRVDSFQPKPAVPPQEGEDDLA